MVVLGRNRVSGLVLKYSEREEASMSSNDPSGVALEEVIELYWPFLSGPGASFAG